MADKGNPKIPNGNVDGNPKIQTAGKTRGYNRRTGRASHSRPFYLRPGTGEFADKYAEFYFNHDWRDLKGECSLLRAQLQFIADALNNEIQNPTEGLFPLLRRFVPLMNSTIVLIDKLTRTNAFLETARPSVPVSAVKGLIKKILSAQNYAFTSTENDPQKIRGFNKRFLQFLGEDGLHVENIFREIEAEDENVTSL